MLKVIINDDISDDEIDMYEEDLDDFAEFLGGTDDYMKDTRIFFGEAIHIR